MIEMILFEMTLKEIFHAVKMMILGLTVSIYPNFPVLHLPLFPII